MLYKKLNKMPGSMQYIVIYRKKWSYFDFNQFETLFFATWKTNT